jgi:uncharacterized protein YqfB (UPF0267 family)
MKNIKTHNQLNKFKNYNHNTVAGVFTVFGLVLLIGISSSSNNLIFAILFFICAFISYKGLKTNKSISISDNYIGLEKWVDGYKRQQIDITSINTIELRIESKSKFNPQLAVAIGDGNTEVHSNYYHIYLKNGKVIKFDNLYDERLKMDLKELEEKDGINVKIDDWK